MSERAKIERLRRMLQRRKLLFIQVGERAGQDRVVAPTVDLYGPSLANDYRGTKHNPDYTRLLRAIVQILEDS